MQTSYIMCGGYGKCRITPAYRCSSTRRATYCAVALALLLAACKSGPPDAKVLESDLHDISRAGYVPEHHYTARISKEVWHVNGATWDVSLAIPNLIGPQQLPVVIYFPGLGESADAGLLWRKPWAESGYLIVSVQPRNISASIWSSSRARAGDFQGIAAEQFSAASVKSRVNELAGIIDELRRRSADHGSNYAWADLTRVALVGYDLGALTASVMSGERLPHGHGTATVVGSQALITISPYFDGAERNVNSSLYETLTRPVLSVTGTDDGDPYTLIASPELRQIPWQRIPASPKYLLVLEGGSHRMLAGDNLIDPESPGIRETSAADMRDRQRNGHHGGGEQFDSTDSSMALDEERTDSRNKTSRGRRNGRATTGPQAYNLLQIAAIQSATVAFLDMSVKKRPEAERWLKRDASAWLDGMGRLTIQ